MKKYSNITWGDIVLIASFLIQFAAVLFIAIIPALPLSTDLKACIYSLGIAFITVLFCAQLVLLDNIIE